MFVLFAYISSKDFLTYTGLIRNSINEAGHEISNNVVCATSKASH